MRAGDAERKIRQRGEESGGTEIATAHYHHLYLSGCRTSNYCCHIAHNEGKHDVCADVFVYIFMYRISFPTFLFFFFFFVLPLQDSFCTFESLCYRAVFLYVFLSKCTRL